MENNILNVIELYALKRGLKTHLYEKKNEKEIAVVATDENQSYCIRLFYSDELSTVINAPVYVASIYEASTDGMLLLVEAVNEDGILIDTLYRRAIW